MKFVIVLFAAMAVASAYPGYYHAPVSHPWSAPAAWPAAAPVYVPAAPSYVKVASAPIVKVHAPEVHQVLQVPQQPSIPPPHPQPLNIKIPHVSAVKIPYHGPKIVHPHLIGVESHYEEPQVKVVKVPISHHPWD
ncbi:uncharacterized protein LOC122534190 [Frieseomelitta varia]|uniref:uncharacterized protein LOC122534190 n=1 Tax=Frieseomelitta varia TaxID=561572 RepID=UPI001CB6A620|nr:uncharacterized protein LOC122534190 [Frieseomelitta varia]